MSEGALFHCDQCSNPYWYVEEGKCSNCGEELRKML